MYGREMSPATSKKKNKLLSNRVRKVLVCLKRYKPEKIILFGSHATGESDEDSDLDFVVIKKTRKRFIRRLIEVARLIDNSLGKVDVFVYSPAEFALMKEQGNSFIENVVRHGKVLYEAR